jgi:hypothetical protein
MQSCCPFSCGVCEGDDEDIGDDRLEYDPLEEGGDGDDDSKPAF